jgi:hypothetical protein
VDKGYYSRRFLVEMTPSYDEPLAEEYHKECDHMGLLDKKMEMPHSTRAGKGNKLGMNNTDTSISSLHLDRLIQLQGVIITGNAFISFIPAYYLRSELSVTGLSGCIRTCTVRWRGVLLCPLLDEPVRHRAARLQRRSENNALQDSTYRVC